jgi:hypothetical protein
LISSTIGRPDESRVTPSARPTIRSVQPSTAKLASTATSGV